jgi:hypothetical protein
MEKTSKIKYGKTTKKDVDSFLKGKKTKEKPKDDKGKEEADSDTIGVYTAINPIQVSVTLKTGENIAFPVGQFLPSPQVFPMHPAVSLFGKRRTGKTFTLRWWMYNAFRDVPFGVVFTNTRVNGFWQTYVPGYLVFQGLPMDKMDVLIRRQKNLIEKWKHDNPEKSKESPDAYKEVPELRAFCIFDDVISDRTAMQWNKDIATFFVEGRHLCISVFITTQHVKGIGPMLRGNLDVVCIQPMFQREARQVLADLYGGFLDREVFQEMMDQVILDEALPESTPQDPKKYVRTLIVNDYENTIDPVVKFKWGEAENPDDMEPGWRLCDDAYWKKQDNQLHAAPIRPTYDVVDELDKFNTVGR